MTIQPRNAMRPQGTARSKRLARGLVAVCGGLGLIFVPNATAAKLVAYGNASAADLTVAETLDVFAAPQQHCTAYVRRGSYAASLGSLRTGHGGGGEWLWSMGRGTLAGSWKATVTCGHASTTASFTAPASAFHSRHATLVARGSLRARATTTQAEKLGGGAAGGGNPYPRGQCTWYVWSKRQDLPWFAGGSGDAKNWTNSARARGIPTGSQPVAGAVVVFQPGQYGTYKTGAGHVAYVERVNGTQIDISELNYNNDQVHVHYRWLPWAGLQFIYGGPAGNGPGQSPSPVQPLAPLMDQPGIYPQRVYHTCANGACGLRAHAAPSLSAAVRNSYNDSAEVDIVCQTSGDAVSGSDGSSSRVWDQLTDSSYVADFYVDTPGTAGGFSAPIPRCGGNQVPAQRPPVQPPPSGNCGVTQDRSLRGDAAATITFINNTDAKVSVYWLDYQGGRQLYFSLNPGAHNSQSTYITHPWVVTDATGICIGYTVADQATKTYNVGPPAVMQPPTQPSPTNGACSITQDRSISSTTVSQITFVNKASDAVKVYWLDYQGGRQLYKTLDPGGSYVQSTYITHPWLITDATSGTCIGYTVSDQASKTYNIGG